MADQRLDARYTALGFLSRVGWCLGLAIAFWFFGSVLPGPKWLSVTCYVLAAVMSIATLGFAYFLVRASGKVALSIDTTGLRDIRVMPAIIPWSAIESVSPYVPYKSRTPTGIELVIAPAFRQNISIRPGDRMFAGASFLWRRALRLDTCVLDADCNEISRVANTYLSRRS